MAAQRLIFKTDPAARLNVGKLFVWFCEIWHNDPIRRLDISRQLMQVWPELRQTTIQTFMADGCYTLLPAGDRVVVEPAFEPAQGDVLFETPLRASDFQYGRNLGWLKEFLRTEEEAKVEQAVAQAAAYVLPFANNDDLPDAWL